ncbi:uncharacterized protein [Ptychodera flava]|uniref:uncharacterized protein n=1 Tax=Ptychodera flava TaxID=63121 RepID=UPI003969BC27
MPFSVPLPKMGHKHTRERRLHCDTLSGKSSRTIEKFTAFERQADVLVDEKNFKKADRKLRKALTCLFEIHGKYTPHPDVAKIQTKLGYVQEKLHDKRKSLHYLERALLTWRQLNSNYLDDPDDKIAYLITDLCRCWRKFGDNEKAVEYGEDAVTMREQLFSSHRNSQTCLSLAYAHYNLGKSYCYPQGDLRKALEHLKRASWCLDEISHHSLFSNKLRDETPMIRFKAKVYTSIGECHKDCGELVLAMNYTKLAFQLFKIVHGANSTHRDITTVLQLMVVIERRVKREVMKR